MKNSNGKIVKLLYASVALFVLAALVLQVIASAGRLPASVPGSFPTFVSAAALIIALVVLVRRLWMIDRLLAPRAANALFPDHPEHEVRQMHEAELQRAERISRLSHELRTPLTSINGFSELLMQDDSLAGEPREFAALIHTEAQRLTAMVNNVLTEAQLATEPVTSNE